MKLNPIHLKLVGLILLAGALSASSQAQVNQATQPKPQSEMWGREVATLRFDDLVIEDIVDILREEFAPINFIVTGARDGGIALNLQLVNVSLDEILRALSIASEEQIQVLRHGDLVQIHQKTPRPTQFETALFRAFPLTAYLKNADGKEEIEKRMSTLERMIIDSWTQFARFRNTRRETFGSLAFHAGANVLVVFGDASEIGIAEQIIAAVQGESVRGPYWSPGQPMPYGPYQGSPGGTNTPYGSMGGFGGLPGGGMAPGAGMDPYSAGDGGLGGGYGSMDSSAGIGGMYGGGYGMGGADFYSAPMDSEELGNGAAMMEGGAPGSQPSPGQNDASTDTGPSPSPFQ